MEDIKAILRDHNEDIKRHIDALKEDFDGNLKLLAESVSGIQQQLISLREMVVRNTEDIEVMKIMLTKNTEDTGIIKTDIQFIKNDLKKKVGQEEFEVLERRVAVLEAKVRQS